MYVFTKKSGVYVSNTVLNNNSNFIVMAQSHCYFSFMKEDATVLGRSSSFSSRFSLFSQSDSSYFIEMCPDVLATLRIGVLKSCWCSYCYFWYCCKEGHFIWCFSTIYCKRENDIFFLHSRSLTPALTVSSSSTLLYT